MIDLTSLNLAWLMLLHIHLFLKLAFLVQQSVVSLVIIAGSLPDAQGRKSATGLGVRSTLIVALILFGISLVFYKLKKED